MNDKELDLIQITLKAAGKAGEQGFAYLVHFTFIDGLTGILGYAIGLAGALYLLRKAFGWKPTGGDAPALYFARGAAIVALCLGSFFMVCGMQTSLRAVLAPEGAAIHDVLERK